MSIQSGNIEEETEELLNAWQEAGSKGLDSWVELPAVYAITDGCCCEPGGSYDYLSVMEQLLVALDGEKAREGYFAPLEYQLAR